MRLIFCSILLISTSLITEAQIPEKHEPEAVSFHDKILQVDPDHPIGQLLRQPIDPKAEEPNFLDPEISKPSEPAKHDAKEPDGGIKNLYPVYEDSDISFQYILPGNSRQCFYYTPTGSFMVDFEVISGDSIPATINVYLNDANGITVGHFIGRVRAKVEVKMKKENYYKPYILCLDNLSSLDNRHSEEKLVDLKIEMSPAAKMRLKLSYYSHAYKDAQINNEELLDLISRDAFIMKTEKIDDRLSEVVGYLRKWRLLHNRDLLHAAFNWSHVSFWSGLQYIVMVTVGLTQVLLIRSLIDENSMFHRIWKKRD